MELAAAVTPDLTTGGLKSSEMGVETEHLVPHYHSESLPMAMQTAEHQHPMGRTVGSKPVLLGLPSSWSQERMKDGGGGR